MQEKNDLPQKKLNAIQQYIESYVGYKEKPDAKKRMEANAQCDLLVHRQARSGPSAMT